MEKYNYLIYSLELYNLSQLILISHRFQQSQVPY